MKKNRSNPENDPIRDQETVTSEEEAAIGEDRARRDQGHFESDTSSYEGADVDDEEIHNPNVDKTRDMKRRERNNIE